MCAHAYETEERVGDGRGVRVAMVMVSGDRRMVKRGDVGVEVRTVISGGKRPNPSDLGS